MSAAAAMAAAASSDGLTTVLEEMTRVYEDTNDFTALARISETKENISTLCEDRQNEIKEIIKELTRKVEDLRSSANPDEIQARFDSEMAGIEDERAATIASMNSLESEIESLREALSVLRKQGAQLSDKRLEIENANRVDVPRIKYALGLFSNISNIRWDYDADTVRGQVLGGTASRTKNFDFSTSENSDFYITNRLWDMIAAV